MSVWPLPVSGPPSAPRSLKRRSTRLPTAIGRARRVDIDLAKIERLDTFGAWLIERLNRAFTANGATAQVIGLSDTGRDLMEEVRLVNRTGAASGAVPNPILAGLDSIGRAVAEIGRSLVLLAHLLGALTMVVLGTIAHPSRLRLTSTVHFLERVGWRAVPIILLSTFLIGAILAQQGIFHFRTFGAEVYVVDMVGILVLREVGVLIVCVMVAGRSGSAYTAELGSMKMREEIDALRTMGFDPVEVLGIAARRCARFGRADAHVPRLDGGALRSGPRLLALWRHAPRHIPRSAA